MKLIFFILNIPFRMCFFVIFNKIKIIDHEKNTVFTNSTYFF